MTAAYGDVPLLDPETGRFPDSFAPLSVAAAIADAQTARQGAEDALDGAVELVGDVAEWDARVAAAEAAVADLIAAVDTSDGMVAQLIADETSQTRAGIGGVIDRARIAPSLQPITEYANPARYVLAQVGAKLYAKWQIGAPPRLNVSTDNGETWTTKSVLPAKVDYLLAAKSGTLLIIEGEVAAGTYPTPANPRVWRSTDDGATWVLVPDVIQFPPLGPQGMAEGADGSLMIAEYGSFRPWVYRVRRSVDDGLTWTTALGSDGRDPGAGDNGHIHSLTADPYQPGRYNIFMDYNVGPNGPEVWTTTDNGATWTLVGKSLTNDQPNFVTPMYFENHIAWGSDNLYNGRVSRLARADFYAGNFAATEHVAQLSEKAIYGAVQVRPGVCAFAVNGEHIISTEQDGLYSTTSEVYLLSDEGELVSGGLASYFANVAPGGLTGVRPHFPYRQYDNTDTGGVFWINFPAGGGRSTYAAVPVTQGWEPPSQRVTFTDTPRIRPGAALLVQGVGGPQDVFRFIERQDSGTVVIANSSVSAGSRSSIEAKANGEIEMRSNGALAAVLTGGVFRAWGRVDVGASEQGLRYSAGRPDGSIFAPQGTVVLTGLTAEPAWVKATSSASNTGWRRLGPYVATSADLASAAHAANMYGKFEGCMVYDSTNDRPMWATGGAATSAWRDAAGGNAITPA